MFLTCAVFLCSGASHEVASSLVAGTEEQLKQLGHLHPAPPLHRHHPWRGPDGASPSQVSAADGDGGNRECSHKGVAERECSHKGVAEGECSHRGVAERECFHKGVAERECFHKGVAEGECSHKGVAERECFHKGVAEGECSHKGWQKGNALKGAAKESFKRPAGNVMTWREENGQFCLSSFATLDQLLLEEKQQTCPSGTRRALLVGLTPSTTSELAFLDDKMFDLITRFVLVLQQTRTGSVTSAGWLLYDEACWGAVLCWNHHPWTVPSTCLAH